MKQLKLLLTLMVAANTILWAQIGNSVSPAIYYTYGDYNNSGNSKGIAGYASVQLGINDLFVAGYENLLIKNQSWNYKQDYEAFGYIKNFYPFYLNLSLAFVQGKFNSPLYDDYDYKDKVYLGDINFSYNYNFYFFGAGATIQQLNGYSNINTQFYYFKLSWMPENTFSISLKPAYTKTDDNREGYSLGGKVFYSPYYFLNFTLSGFVGKRVFYFDPDYLTLFNQYETQRNSYGINMKIIPVKYLTVVAGYNFADFTDYNITYYTVGLKYIIRL